MNAFFNNKINKGIDFLIIKKELVSQFKSKYTFEKRKSESEAIISKYPHRIPVICERYDKSLPNLDRKKYLIPEDLSMGNFIYVIRKRLKLNSHVSLYLLVNNKVPPVSFSMSHIYDKYQDEDGFLYIKYCEEATFGF